MTIKKINNKTDLYKKLLALDWVYLFLYLSCACNQVQPLEIDSSISERFDESLTVFVETEASFETSEETTIPVKDTVYRLEDMSAEEIYNNCIFILSQLQPGRDIDEYYDSLKACSTTQDLTKLDWTFDWPEPFVNCIVDVNFSCSRVYAREDYTINDYWEGDEGPWLYTTFLIYVQEENIAKAFYECAISDPYVSSIIIGDYQEDNSWTAYMGNPAIGYTEDAVQYAWKPLVQIQPVEINGQLLWEIQFTTLDI